MGEVSSMRCLVPSLQTQRHFMGQCRSKTVTPVYSGDSPDTAMDSAFLGVIGTNQEPTWKMKLQLSGQETEFNIRSDFPGYRRLPTHCTQQETL